MGGLRSRVELARQTAIRVWRTLGEGTAATSAGSPAESADVGAPPSIVAVGIAGKVRYPRRLVTVYVNRQSDQLSAVRAAMPKRCHGVTIRIEECDVTAHAAEAGPAARPDLSVGNAGFQVGGTLSGIARRGRRREWYAFSCLHVLAPAATVKNGDFVLQPAVLDGGQNPRDLLGVLEDLDAARRSAQRGQTDAALVRVGATRAPWIEDYSDAVTVGSPELLNDVWMIGRTSGVRHGRVMELNARVPCGAQLLANGLRIESADAQPFSQRGDSGALVWDTRGRHAVGIVAGGYESGDAAILRIEPILRLFGLSKLRAFRGDRNLALMLQGAWELA